MRQSFHFLTICLVLLAVNLSAQQNDIPFDDLPPNPEDGKCYAKCKVPDEYATVEIQKLKKAGTAKLIKAKPEYRTETERVVIKEATFKYVSKPATYETVEKQVLVKAGYCTREVIPAKYTYKQTNKRLVAEATGKWVRKKKAPNCFSENPDDCYIMCWEKVPAQYAYDSERILVEDQKEIIKEVDPVYKTMKVQVIKTPATYERVEIPAVYKTIKKQVLVNSDCLEDKYETTPDQYTTVKEKRLVSSGGYTGWVEILCEAKTTNSVIKEVQERLNAEGYNVGAVDGIMGTRTRTMLEKYQNDKNLPVGNLNIETLKSLGIKTDN